MRTESAAGAIGIGLFRKIRRGRLHQEEKDLNEAIHDIEEQLAAMKTKENLQIKDVIEYPQVRKVYNRLISEGITPSLRSD